MKRVKLSVCVDCRPDEGMDGETFFRALKAARRELELKPVVKLVESDCLDGCDTPCNARLKGKDRPTLYVTGLSAADARGLLEAAARYARAEGALSHRALGLPGRRGDDT